MLKIRQNAAFFKVKLQDKNIKANKIENMMGVTCDGCNWSPKCIKN